MDRRKFLQATGAGIVAGAISPGLLAETTAGSPGKQPALHLFSKHLQFLDYPGMARAAAAMGLDGLDLSVRPGGHVEPDRFANDLPKAIGAITDAGLGCEMMTTGITGADVRRDYDLLALARELGVKFYRLGFLRYDEGTDLMVSVERYRERLAALAEWNREIGITGLVQNHSGAERFGAAVWDAWLVLKDMDPDAMGMQFDVRHAVTDGGRMWPTSFRLVKSHIRAPIFKDFKWGRVNGEWELINTPFGQGMVDFKRYFGMLKEAGIQGPFSLHCEYDSLGGANKGRRELTIPEKEVFAAIRRDIEAIRTLWQEA
jgi:sugar phosphate isomerase/epimerase